MSRARDLGGSITSTVAGKNLLINGNFDYWQRGTTGLTAYGPDRWFNFGVGTMSRQSFSATPEVPNATYYLRYVNTSTGYQMVQQTIENGGIDLSGKTITISFWARSNTNNSFSMACFSLLNNDQQPTTLIDTYGFTVTPTWTKYSYTANVPVTNGTNPHRYFRIGMNTAGVGFGFDLAQVQLEVGSIVTSFSRAGVSLENELALCQRYYYRWNQPTNTSTSFIGSANSVNEIWWNMFHPTSMRSAPSVTTNINGASSGASPSTNQVGFYQGGFKTHTGFGSVSAFGINTDVTLMRLYALFSGISIGTSGTVDFGGGCIIEFNSEI